MQRAGEQVFEFIKNNFSNKKPIIVLCGPGNNGGDGFVIAKHLMNHGYRVKVYIYANKNHYKGDALKALKDFKGSVKKLPGNVKIPHMGWNMVNFKKPNGSLFALPKNEYFYFVHSYYVVPSDNSLICGKTEYGLEFCSAVTYKNIFAVQFHPERSGEIGLQIYKNFVSLTNC